MRKLSRTAAGGAVTGAAVLAALALAAGPASAATVNQVVVSNGGTVTANAPTPTLTDNKTGTKLTCTSATASATVPTATAAGPAPVTVGHITAAAWQTCKLNSITFSVSAGSLPWTIAVTDVTDASGNTPGEITGVVAHLSGLCNATVAGTVTGHYANSTHTLVIDSGTLAVSGVSGLCLGLINNGDSVTYKANYALTPAAMTINAS